MGSTANLAIILTLKDKARAELSKSEKSLNGYRKTVGMVGAAVMGAGLAIAGGSMKMAADVGSAYTIIMAGTGATGSQMEALKGVFNRTYKSVAADMKTTATVIADLNTLLGLEGVALEGMSHQMLEASRMTGAEPVSANQAFAKAINAWRVPASGAPALLDKMFVAGQKTGVGIAGLSTLMTEYGSGLRQLGLSMDETISMLSGLYAAGYPVSRIMPAMAMASRKFAEQNIPLNAGLKETIERMQGAESDAKALSLAMGVFGAEGATALTDAVRSGAFSLTGLEAELDQSQGAVQQFSTATEDTYTKMALLKHQTEMLSASVGAALLPALVPLVGMATPMLEKMASFTEKHSTLSAVILASVTAGGGFMVLMSILPKIQAGYIALTTAMHSNRLAAVKTSAVYMGNVVKSMAAATAASVGYAVKLVTIVIPAMIGQLAAMGPAGWAIIAGVAAATVAGVIAIKKAMGLAEGGLVTQGGAFIVGERGKELVTLPAGAAVTPLPAGAGGGITNNFYIESMSVRGDEDIEAIAEELYRKQKAAERSWGIKRNE